MLTAVAALLVLILIAAGVTVSDALRSPHWRVVADERKHAWRERAGQDRGGAGADADQAPAWVRASAQ